MYLPKCQIIILTVTHVEIICNVMISKPIKSQSIAVYIIYFWKENESATISENINISFLWGFAHS